jgi:hypothetical protein
LWIWRRRRSAALTPVPSSSAVIHVSEDGTTMLRRRWHPSWEWRWHLRQHRVSETLVFGAIHGCREGIRLHVGSHDTIVHGAVCGIGQGVRLHAADNSTPMSLAHLVCLRDAKKKN